MFCIPVLLSILSTNLTLVLLKAQSHLPFAAYTVCAYLHYYVVKYMYMLLQWLITLHQNLFKAPYYAVIINWIMMIITLSLLSVPLGRRLCGNVCRSHSLPSGHHKDKAAEPAGLLQDGRFPWDLRRGPVCCYRLLSQW